MAKKIRIFIVEDDPILSLYLGHELTEIGYDVVGSAESGEEALNRIPEVKPEFVFMDISLKGSIDGIEAASQLRTKYPVPFVFLTGFADEETRQRAKVTQPCGYILKPFDPAELHAVIRLGIPNLSESGEAKLI